ncbi:helix-turn-helix protein [Pseudoduganella lurida]|uniref:Helix-turn-helix protein n=1 Tax=Pseudoduganella lurida TaxID=1036180 RepID=A0A562R273_9BURK|nr:transcriptional regulator [Pseudoduganella lurida]TWI62560.1 helix-turn-helix protein [Pseudoduganella lurida]
MYNQIFFTNVLRLLDILGMTKNDLADHAGISVSFLSDLTNGKANPSLKILEAIAAALQTSLPALLETTDLDKKTLESLAGETPWRLLPDGFIHVSAILTDFQAFTVRQWHEDNVKKIDIAKK